MEDKKQGCSTTECCTTDQSCKTTTGCCASTKCCTTDQSCTTEGGSCATSACGTKKKCCGMVKFFIAIVVAFVALFGFDWIFHGTIMMDSYKATAAMWRPEVEMQSYVWVCIVRQIVTAIIFACLFCKCLKTCGGCCPVMKGMKLGLKLGLLLGIAAFGTYAWMPIPMEMALAWLAGETVKGVFVGAVLGVCYKLQNKAN